MNVRSYEAPLMVYSEYRWHKALFLYVPPILLVLGTLGNFFSFVILRRKSMRKFSTYLYLSILSVADTLVLYVGLLRLWIGELTGSDFKDTNVWICKFVTVFGYTVSDYSVWLIIAVTVERYIVVANPFKIQTMCNIMRAVKIMLGIFAVLLAINAHFFWTVEIRTHPYGGKNITMCGGGPNYEVLVGDAWPWVDTCLYSFIPFVVILILNVLIIRHVLKARKSRSQLQSSADAKQAANYHDSTRMTIMLLSISFTFLITTLPMNISSIAKIFWKLRNHKGLAQYTLLRTITTLLMYLNHSMNFVIYCVTGRKFRQQLLWMLCGRFPALSNWLTEPSHSGNTHYHMQSVRAAQGTKLENNNGASEVSRLVRNEQIGSESPFGTPKHKRVRTEQIVNDSPYASPKNKRNGILKNDAPYSSHVKPFRYIRT